MCVGPEFLRNFLTFAKGKVWEKVAGYIEQNSFVTIRVFGHYLCFTLHSI
jgi:hypothetical protein